MNTKTNNKISKEAVRRKISLLLNSGAALSNIAFNYKQETDIPENVRVALDTFQKRWDEAYRNLPRWMTKVL